MKQCLACKRKLYPKNKSGYCYICYQKIQALDARDSRPIKYHNYPTKQVTRVNYKSGYMNVSENNYYRKLYQLRKQIDFS